MHQIDSKGTRAKCRQIFSLPHAFSLNHIKEETNGSHHNQCRTIPEEKGNWIPNENRRKEEFKKIIANGEHSELIKMIKSLYLQREKREIEGKHLYLSDERFLKEAERILCDEFRYVLEIEREEVLTYLKK